MVNVILAVRKANLAYTRIDRWQRRAVDALNRGDLAAAGRAERHLVRAQRDARKYQSEMRFPWEV